MTAIEDDRVSAARHVLHLKALKQYQKKTRKTALTSEDIETMYNEGRVMESENHDVEMEDSSQNQSFTPQSLSFNGFSDSDSDYIPD
jgi:hypothetical protein